MAVSVVVSLVVVTFITVEFAWSSLLLDMASICIILPHMGLQLQRLSLTHPLLFKNVVLRTSDVIYYFRVKNGKDNQNVWVASFSSAVVRCLLQCAYQWRLISECRLIMIVGMVVSVVVFINVVFVWSSLHVASLCIILHHIGLQLHRLSILIISCSRR